MDLDDTFGITIEKEKIKSLRDVALETLRDAIISGRLKPGQHLKERELSTSMGISTTPIKEAIRILSYEGLVDSIPRKGNYVSKLADTSISDIMFFRAELEGYAAKLAAEKMTDTEVNKLENYIMKAELILDSNDLHIVDKMTDINNGFHMCIRKATKNPLILNVIMNIVGFDKSFRKRALLHDDELERGVSEHKEIFKAIKERNPFLAEQKMKDHIQRTAENVLNKLTEI